MYSISLFNSELLILIRLIVSIGYRGFYDTDSPLQVDTAQSPHRTAQHPCVGLLVAIAHERSEAIYLG
jgi:hypothetical protein